MRVDRQITRCNLAQASYHRTRCAASILTLTLTLTLPLEDPALLPARAAQNLRNALTHCFNIGHVAFVGCGDGVGDPHIQSILQFSNLLQTNAHTVRHVALCSDEEFYSLAHDLVVQF
jgi:hypothetical protein